MTSSWSVCPPKLDAALPPRRTKAFLKQAFCRTSHKPRLWNNNKSIPYAHFIKHGIIELMGGGAVLCEAQRCSLTSQEVEGRTGRLEVCLHYYQTCALMRPFLDFTALSDVTRTSAGITTRASTPPSLLWWEIKKTHTLSLNSLNA